MARRNNMPLWMANQVTADMERIGQLKPGTKEWQGAVLAFWKRTLIWVTRQNLNYPRPEVADACKTALTVLGVDKVEDLEAMTIKPAYMTTVGMNMSVEVLHTDQPAFPMLVINPTTWDDWLEEMLQQRKGGFTPEWLGRLYNGEYIVRVDPRMEPMKAQFITPIYPPKLANY